MADLQYGVSAYSRNRGNLPALPVINMFVEQSPTEQSPLLQSRPGLTNAISPIGTGTSPIKAMYSVEGVFNGTLYEVRNDNQFFSGGLQLGTINSSAPGYVSFAGYSNALFMAAGSSLWYWNGTTLATVATPGSFQVTACCVGASHLIVIDKGTGKFYWSDPLGTSLPSLNFATAEASPDNLQDCLYVGDMLVLFGDETVELWPVTGDANAPFAPLVGKTMTVGIHGTGACTLFNRSFAWITNHNQICFGDQSNIISHPGIEEIINASSNPRLWTFWLEGTEFLALDTMGSDPAVWVYSSRTQQWSQFTSAGQSTWIPCCYAGGMFGSRILNQLLQWSTDHKDLGGTLERRFRGGIELTGDIVFLNNILLRCNPGRTPYTNPTTYYNPTISLKFSKDEGASFSSPYVKSLGLNGEYRKLVNWRSLGRFKFPSLLVEITVTDPVPFRVSGLKMNEAYPN